MIFKQFFDTESSTLTYLLAGEDRQGVIIDPVKTHVDDYLQTIQDLGITLVHALETHVHADHVTAGAALRAQLGITTAVGEACGAETADLQLNDGDIISFGEESIRVIATPGHTVGSVSYYWHDRLFTGDALLINGCGRTDFQGGDAKVLYHSITQKIFTLPEETLIYPGHDYQGRRVSSVAQEKGINPRLADKSEHDFVAIMESLNLPKPKMIDVAVPANKKCGLDETDILQG